MIFKKRRENEAKLGLFSSRGVFLALRVFLAAIRLTIDRQCEVGGWVIGAPLGSKLIYYLDIGFSVITFSPVVQFK